MKLKVYLNQTRVGTLIKTRAPGVEFAYDTRWLALPNVYPVSLSLPLASETYAAEKATPFFDGLLPEGSIRAHIARSLHVSEQNTFDLLAEIGKECAGALSFWKENEEVVFAGDYLPLSKAQLNEKICGKHHPLILDLDELRLSLAGAQEKTALYLHNGEWYQPTGLSPSSHILKPPIERFQNTVENEAFCMTLAKEVGLPVTDIDILQLDSPVLAVKRYDRPATENGLVRLHQEDFSQALGVPVLKKYENDGGPKLANCFQLLEQHSIDPLLDRKKLLDWTIFNYYIGNADAHAKNLSWLINENGFKLAPFYDLLSTAVYPDLSEKMAMKIGGEHRLDWIFPRHWEKLSEQTGIHKNLVVKRLKEFGREISSASESLCKKFFAQYGKNEILMSIVMQIKKRLIAVTP